MNELIKIKDVTIKYDITARTLRYYEDMGLISSARSEYYAYRTYDEAAVKRLEQILILRKLNISIKDIHRIFNTPGSGVVLEILNKKVKNIDDEVALLHELKDIVLDFIHEMERLDFGNDSNVKLLYNKAKEIETHLISVDYIGKPSNITRLIEVTEQLDKKIPDVLVVRIPKCWALVSKYLPIGELFSSSEENLMGWMDDKRHLVKNVVCDCGDFLCRRSDGIFRWLFCLNERTVETDTAPFDVIEFEGGLYACAVSIDNDNESIGKVENKISKWLENTNFTYDKERDVLGTMPYLNEDNGDEIKKGLGYYQLLRNVPIKLKEEI